MRSRGTNCIVLSQGLSLPLKPGPRALGAFSVHLCSELKREEIVGSAGRRNVAESCVSRNSCSHMLVDSSLCGEDVGILRGGEKWWLWNWIGGLLREENRVLHANGAIDARIDIGREWRDGRRWELIESRGVSWLCVCCLGWAFRTPCETLEGCWFWW